MSTVLQSYAPALVFIVLGAVIGILFSVLNTVLGSKRAVASKTDPYECGLPSEVQSNFRFGISFYLIAMLFILFDLEIVFSYPWAVVFREFIERGDKTIFWSMLSFVGILTIGYVYAIKKGALDWKR